MSMLDRLAAFDPDTDADANTFHAELTTLYNEDVAGLNDVAGAKVAELEAQLADLTASIQTLKAANYDLLRSVGTDVDDDTTGLIGDDDGGTDEAPDIDDLFD